MLQNQSRRLGIEALEIRDLMAGNVTVKVTNGNFLLTGDAAANALAVTQPTTGHLLVQGVGGTKVNGKASVDVAFTGNATFNLAGGADRLTIGPDVGLVRFKSLAINAGAGADQVAIRNVIGQDLKANLGAESEAAADTLDVRQSVFRGAVTILTGGGNDAVNFSGFRSQGSLAMSSGSGNDTLTSEGCTYADLFVDFRAGDDTIMFSGKSLLHGLTAIKGGVGTDSSFRTPESSFTIDQPDFQIGTGFETGNIDLLFDGDQESS